FMTDGSSNTAVGHETLKELTSGANNTAIGSDAATALTTGSGNTVAGSGAAIALTTGSGNTVAGNGAAVALTTGGNNTVVGAGGAALLVTGASNLALGYSALSKLTSGGTNIAVGASAGSTYTTESNNIAVGNTGTAADTGVIRLGTVGTQTKTFVAGINGVTLGATGNIVLVDSNGQLGTIQSSRRYKEDIAPMGEASARLLKLRPVTFKYKKDQPGDERTVQFGLIAEEVAEVFPELVIYNKEGKPETVAYHLLATMLLNELQKNAAELRSTQQLLTDQKSRISRQQTEINAIKSQVRDLAVIKTLLRKQGMYAAPVLAAESR
ncbi:MAG: hypothetical protein EBR15_09260, partial [Gammaproteobacteria bacterium]|nr:hypothetical protein [Gammaproteobacteria bacterium]